VVHLRHSFDFKHDRALAEGIRRVEDVIAGRTKPLTDAEYRAALE